MNDCCLLLGLQTPTSITVAPTTHSDKMLLLAPPTTQPNHLTSPSVNNGASTLVSLQDESVVLLFNNTNWCKSLNTPLPVVTKNPPVPTKDHEDPHSESSDSDLYISDAYIWSKRTYSHLKMSSNIATLKHLVTKHCPVLTDRDLTPQTLLQAENAFNKFFIAKSVAKEDKVKMILGAFKDMHIRDWIATNQEHLLDSTFKDFMAELHTNFLPSNLVETICISLLGRACQRTNVFGILH